MTSPPSRRGRRDNGLQSDTFTPIADVDPRLADHLLDVLGLREVPAYVEPAPATTPMMADRLFVAAELTEPARHILAEIANELGIRIAPNGYQQAPPSAAAGDVLAGVDTDAEFAAIIAGLEGLNRPLANSPDSADSTDSYARFIGTAPADTVDATEHYIPPTPPPVPRPAAPTAFAIVVTFVGILVIAFGSMVGLSPDLPLPLGVTLILFGASMFVMRLRPDPRDDSEDDGAIV